MVEDRLIEITTSSNMETTIVPVTQQRNSFYCPNVKHGKSSEECCSVLVHRKAGAGKAEQNSRYSYTETSDWSNHGARLRQGAAGGFRSFETCSLSHTTTMVPSSIATEPLRAHVHSFVSSTLRDLHRLTRRSLPTEAIAKGRRNREHCGSGPRICFSPDDPRRQQPARLVQGY